MSGNFDLTKLSDEVVRDILELQQNVNLFKTGKMNEERFKHYRLTRGVYGQRQFGVQMFRTKIPFGKITADQLICLADVAEKFTNGNLHLTTRQNIQMHYIKVEDSAEIWSALAHAGVTAREACGNTVRNITASAHAGIDPEELFDVSPYVQASYEYFLRNTICQDMGRKIKIAFSSSDKDSAFTYFHDFGFIPRIKEINGESVRGFKVLVGGGLGAQTIVAPTAYEFLEEDRIIPFMEAAIRVFDRYGEREKRFKARMKFLVKSLGLEAFMELVEKEKKANKVKSFKIDRKLHQDFIPTEIDLKETEIHDSNKFEDWKKTNLYKQKQNGFYAVQIRILKGDIDADKARKLAAIVKKYATAEDIRLSVNQGAILKFVRPQYFKHLFNELDALGLAEPGFDTLADVTSCPGTDTCALGVTNSMALAVELENLIKEKFPQFLDESNIKMKISGCMNSCGQHMVASIGFHGSSIKKRPLIIPAMQIVLGGGIEANGEASVAQKVIKLPTKRILKAVTLILEDYETHAPEDVYFNQYFKSRGKIYFYDLLKPLANVDNIADDEFIDWGEDKAYKQEIGVGECAGASYDVVGTILQDAKEKIEEASNSLISKKWADAIYQSYTANVIAAKALLLGADIKCNTHIGIINDFQSHFIDNGLIPHIENFHDLIFQINKFEAHEAFAQNYFKQASAFVQMAKLYREKDIAGGDDKEVINSHYKA